ncbi:MBL fold metallo-hydrolase [Paenibacillus senegalimassiliensis]|uniref:MBL fold metallo-hydrolase n=1 Tax=Paenibacillus senegalimassiliensis TaxID=1737426 RepID=UPI00073E66DE|nr:MBL fold metallo-hydrolase [Paenibacillus senegalimassiliensis]
MSKLVTVNTVSQLAFLPNVFPVNCYLVEEQDGLTLIDTGMSFSAKGILQTAERLGQPITRIVLTHAHLDHVGGLDLLKEALPDVPVYISRRDALLLEGDLSLLPEEPNTPIRGSVPTKVKTRADVLLQDGDHVGSLLAIAVPGHTPGSMAFLDTRNRILIAGDAFQTRGGIAVSGKVKPWFPFPALATWCKTEAIESARKLIELQPALLAVGHGPMLEQPIDAIRRAIMEAEAAPSLVQH